jgi:hypothetical protein
MDSLHQLNVGRALVLNFPWSGEGVRTGTLKHFEQAVRWGACSPPCLDAALEAICHVGDERGGWGKRGGGGGDLAAGAARRAGSD